jgi:alpha-ketoglutarate-dependent taurine dioxygenase
VRFRRGFNASLDQSAVTVQMGLLDAMTPDELREVVRRYNLFGFVILKPRSDLGYSASLLALRRYLGGVCRHARSDETGIAVIEASVQRPGYLGTSNGPHHPHTDGAYQPVPPKFVAMYCETAATIGGTSTLVSAKTILDRLIITSAELIHVLFDKDAVTIRREHESVTTSVFSRVGDAIHMVFRDDNTASVTVKPAARTAFAALRDLVFAPDFIYSHLLAAGEILVVDNTAVLHGRTSFEHRAEAPRRLHRLTFDGRGAHDLGFLNGFQCDHEMFTRNHIDTRVQP